jgi:CheY-like chemotaxis protein
MVDQRQFFGYVEEVFARLDDRPFLLAHPLPRLLAAPGQPATPESLRRSLLAAIEQLRPPEGTPSNLANWRRWHHLILRYVSGLSTKQIARQLVVSARQARRDHESGVAAVAAILWSGYVQRTRATKPGPEPIPARPRSPVPDAAPEQNEFEDEVAQLALQSANRSTNLADVLGSALSTIHSLVSEHPARVEVSLPGDLWPVAASPAIVRQVLLCLLTAAMHDDSTRRIRLSLVNGPAAVCLSIAVGDGHTAWSGPATANDQALVVAAQHLIEAEGGTIRVEEAPDHSATLVLRLPATPAVRVLVIDDNPDVAHLFRRFLAGSHYQLIQARTPSTALTLAHELRPDVIILDVLMPSQDGWQILQQLRTDPAIHRVPVIVCSILPERPLALSLAAADFLAKPVTKQSLLAALARCREASGSTERPGSPADTSLVPLPSILRPG